MRNDDIGVIFMNRYKDFFKESISEYGLLLSDEKWECLCNFYKMLLEKNKVMNLTAITDPFDVVVKHFLDSLSLCSVFDFTECSSVVDVGTGAGFPGIVLKIFFPEINFVLVDSLGKRVSFLEDVISEISLKNICAIHGRAEDLGHDLKYREQFDLCVSRAVANIATLCEYCIPFVKVGGSFIAYKSGNTDDDPEKFEKAVNELGGEKYFSKKFVLNGEFDRSFICI